MNENISITGDYTNNKTSLLTKVGIGIFLTGLLLLVFSYQKSKDTNLIITSFTAMIVGIFLFLKTEKLNQGTIPLFGKTTNIPQKLGLISGFIGFSVLIIAWIGVELKPQSLFFAIATGGISLGAILFSIGSYSGKTKGIKNNNVWANSLSSRGILAWALGILLTIFYIQLYWFGDMLSGLTELFSPFSFVLRGKPADQWFVYGTIYSLVILFLGIKFIFKYRHNRYQIIRTIVVIISQLVFAYFLPQILESMNEGGGYFDRDLKNVWPLNYSFGDANRLNAMAQPTKVGPSGTFYFVWGIVLFLIITPFLTYLVGKRWYCSWVCGCGGLAETAGDSFRQLSSKSTNSWKIERWLIHSVMVFVLIMTIGILWPYFSGKDYVLSIGTITKNSYYYFTIALILLSSFGLYFLSKKHNRKVLLVGSLILLAIGLLLTIGYLTGSQKIFYLKSSSLKKVYGFFVGASFSGIIGVGFYPMLGNRVWCRFGCPMAGYMGLFQRFKSRFRITTNGGQCISCGNCSTYCEQGIDVRAYAQKKENIVRSSCVGCGICSAVCPRGVLKLENGPEEGRFETNALIITKEGVKLNN
jgi:polyferredoxin